MPAFFAVTLVDVCGEGPFQELVFLEGGGPEMPVSLQLNLEKPAEIGTRFAYGGLTWELTRELRAKPGAVEGGDSLWQARPVQQ